MWNVRHGSKGGRCDMFNNVQADHHLLISAASGYRDCRCWQWRRGRHLYLLHESRPNYPLSCQFSSAVPAPAHLLAPGVMVFQTASNDFLWTETDEPHASRRKQILAAHPEIKELFGPDPWTCPQILAVFLLQVWTAIACQNASWPALIALAYMFGAFLNHNLFLGIHELSHNLAFVTPLRNRVLALLANLPIGIPMAVTFQKYHLEHHRFTGIEGQDMDIPSYAEGRMVSNVLMKVLWLNLQILVYGSRALFLNPKRPGVWEAINLCTQLAFEAWLLYYAGWRSLVYLMLSTFFGSGMHPIAGHFISEHYVVADGQETYSYYGPLNILAWNVGYHNEHHDFPRIPGCRLHRVRQIAPEFYDHLIHHTSWTHVIYKFIMDPTVSPFNRTVRKPKPSVRHNARNAMQTISKANTM